MKINMKENKINSFNNEIICIYNKQDDEIKLLHDYNFNIEKWSEKEKKSYLDVKII